VLTLVAALVACAPVGEPGLEPPPEPVMAFPDREYAALAADGVAVYELDPRRSVLRVLVFRAGPLARFGHDHVVVADAFRGRVAWDGLSSTDTRLDFWIRVAGLDVDPPAERRRLGGDFAAPVPAEDAAATRANLLGPDVLAAASHPWIRLRLAAVAGALPRPILTLAVSLRGVTREVEVPVAVTLEDADLVAEGRLVLRQSEFGIEPFSVMGGALRVADPVLVEFRLAGRRLRP
jgi:polyisoprenoid-binding protein YceI